ncbi:LON peptidase substrate-binding domain-containing protein [Chondrinema litorale]|uniref:LON peptidase substrate-binding domain-containing protein n=1 Tax=Chondrinema litorale TaxID=2994555 RepID=UPI0025437A18|nr:LON peptidase substrate-binding domain-containing protein [Chondrinema litorale]UZR95419.1 LON peptidase substrate-binding domain-containing protein [Chondrinema litorale]
MDVSLAFFPLGLVVFPNEPLNLHIFEPRYKQLINDCKESGITFGILPYINDSIKSYGTEVKLTGIVNDYSDGRMDITTEALRVFKWKSFNNPMEDKLYAGGNIEYISNKDDSSLEQRQVLIETSKELLTLMQIEMEIDENQEFLSYYLGHKLGLSLSQEYDLLTTGSERERINILLNHLSKSIPILQESEKSKERIKLNGHFKYFNPLTF